MPLDNLITRLVESKVIEIPKEFTDSTTAICSIVFDREAYQPGFFMRLWPKYRIAVIAYLKNVKHKWEEESFKDHSVTTGFLKKQASFASAKQHWVDISSDRSTA